MSLTSTTVYYDPFDSGIRVNPYPVYRRLRDEAPLYYNERFDFYAVSRFADVERVLVDRDTFISSKGIVLEVLKSGAEIPPGLFIFEDAPIHTIHRNLVSRVFTVKRMNAIEGQVRDYCSRVIDAHAGTGRFDFTRDLGEVPMRVIGMLLGIPEADQLVIRDQFDAVRDEKHGPRPEVVERPGAPDEHGDFSMSMARDLFGEYLDWRVKNPSDDLMTQLLNVEFEDETGAVRKLSRNEILIIVNIIAHAGSDTTRRMFGWTGKILADHPDQRRELVENPSLIPQAVEEILRFEPPPYHVARYVAKDVEFHGQTVPKGSAMVVLPGSANHDERRFPPDGDVFDIHREASQILSFGFGAHYCLGAALARIEGRVALAEVLKRFPTWEVDWDNAQMAEATDLRGFDSLPVFV